LQSIADNLTALRLDPLLHLKIPNAIVAPLLAPDGLQPPGAILPTPPPEQLAGGRRRPSRRARKRKRSEPVPIAYDGQTFPLAVRLPSISRRSSARFPAALRALVEASDDTEADVRRFQPETRPEVTFRRGRNQAFSEADLNPPPRRPPALSPEGHARVWLEERFAERACRRLGLRRRHREA
jgi:hypothetical protein